MKKRKTGLSKRLLLHKIHITALTGQVDVLGGGVSEIKCTSIPPIIDSMRCSDSQIDCSPTATQKTCFTRTVICVPYPVTGQKCY